jgi:S-adenosylmethionine:tRNA ribosyltransferase-isomerase
MRGLRRDHVKLLVVDAARRTLEHGRFDALPGHLGPGDLLVLNTSRTVAAGIPGFRGDGTPIQVRPCVRREGSWDVLAVQSAPPFANVVLHEGERLSIGGLPGVVLGRRADIPLLWTVSMGTDGLGEMAATGSPIRYSYVTEPVPLDYYQTVYAGPPGSAEMPSAGRPLSWEVLRALEARGIGVADLVLHTGLSSYQDDDFDLEHHLYEERYEVSDETAEAVNAARRVVAVGTTVVRALESAVGEDGLVHAARGWTTLQIRSGMRLRAVDAMITGLHEPQASHFDLLGAFLEEDLLDRAYATAVQHRYLFHEFGDSMLVFGPPRVAGRAG